jgi:hypothetical protein
VQKIYNNTKSIGIFMAVMMLIISTPYQSALAALIKTETILAGTQAEESREYLEQVLARDDVRSALLMQGIDPTEAAQRVASLTDSEVIELADQIENLPAGQGAIGFAIGVLIIVLLVVLIAKLI